MELGSTFPLQQIHSLIRHLTTSSHRNQSPLRDHPSLPAKQDKIRLRLEIWIEILAELINTDDFVHTRIEKNLYLQRRILEWSLHNSDNPVSSRRPLTWRRLLSGSQDQMMRETFPTFISSKVQYEHAAELRNLCIHGFPLFNIWDNISFIYTICAEDVTTQLGTELHLYQFRIVIKALNDYKAYFIELIQWPH